MLVVDDDPDVLRGVVRLLRSQGYSVTSTMNGAEAARFVHGRSFDVIVSDIKMPGMDGIQLLREVREHDLHVPVVLVTGEPAVSTAVQALEYGAFHYLTKPVDTEALVRAVAKAVSMHRMARVKQQAAELLGHAGALGADRAGLEASFDRAMQSLWMAYHPIVDFRRKPFTATKRCCAATSRVCRTRAPCSTPPLGSGAWTALGRSIRELAAAPMIAGGTEMLFVNLHVTDLVDPWLSAPDSPLSQIAHRVVLEVTERSSLDEVKDVRARVAALREMGFRIAVDDLGAGYAGLTSFTLLEPEIVKLDMSLVRDVHKNSTKQKVIRSMTALSQDMGMTVVAEGVETVEERDTLIELDCDLLQGFLFARPGTPFPEVKW